MTDGIYAGDIGVKGADEACDKAGAALDPRAIWVAVLGPRGKDIRNRVKVTKDVFNYAGMYVTSPSHFFVGDWVSAVRYTETGLNIEGSVVKDSDPPVVVTRAWTGLRHDGTPSAGGNCRDWTSNDHEDTGGVGAVGRLGTNSLGDSTRRCNRKQRLLCLSVIPD